MVLPQTCTHKASKQAVMTQHTEAVFAFMQWNNNN